MSTQETRRCGACRDLGGDHTEVLGCRFAPPDPTRPTGRDAIDGALQSLIPDDREAVEHWLSTPDLYPARNIQVGLADIGVRVRIPDIHAWRRARNIKKATC